MFTKIIFPNDKSFTDTAQCILADKKGKWLGDGIGDIKESLFKYKNKRRFPLDGNYKIKIQHAMRKDTLKGIIDVGFKIKKSQKINEK